jgi:hypothetical protein
VTSNAANETWSRHRMFGVGAALFAVHLGLIWLLSSRSPAKASASPERPLVHWIAEPLDAPTLATVLLVEDPTLGVGPSMHSFSALGWLRPPALHTIETGWSEPPRYLDPNPEYFGNALLATEPTNKSAAPSLGYEPAVDQLLARPRLASEPVRPKSEWELSAPLRIRLANQPGDLPSWENIEPLKDTRIDLRVDSEGLIQTVRLRESCGLAIADQWAIAAAWKLSFAESAATAAAMEDGRLVFRWLTIPPTNAATQTP